MFVNLFCNIIFYDFDLRYHQSSSSGGGKRWLHYNITSKPTPANIRERNIAVTSYYNQTAIDHAIEKVKVSSSFFETLLAPIQSSLADLFFQHLYYLLFRTLFVSPQQRSCTVADLTMDFMSW
jgi:hypothetical protein